MHARRLQEAARSVFDGLVIVLATLVGVATAHGAAWIASAVGAVVLALVCRAVALWFLEPGYDELLESLDVLEEHLDAMDRYERP